MKGSRAVSGPVGPLGPRSDRPRAAISTGKRVAVGA